VLTDDGLSGKYDSLLVLAKSEDYLAQFSLKKKSKVVVVQVRLPPQIIQ